MTSPSKHIAHLDLDCFFVSVERIHDPSLIGKPVAVGGTPTGRGVVASASYEARAFGVRSAMPTGQALRLCPQLIVVQGHYKDYSAASDKIYRRLLEFAPLVERASIDEMYLDLTGCESLYHHDLPGLIRRLQIVIREEFSLPCTISLASNKTIAKIATDRVKPEGICVVPQGTEMQFLAPLPITVIPGVGPKTEAFLERKGFHTVSDLQAVHMEHLEELLGAHGIWLSRVAHGGGSETVHRDYVRKSIGKEETFGHDIADRQELERLLYGLVEAVCARLRAKGWKARTVSLKLRYSDFKTLHRDHTIDPTNDDPIVFRTACELFHAAFTRKLPIRLLGVQLSNFVRDEQLDLFRFSPESKRGQALDAVDALREKFGDEVIHVGGST